MSDLAQKLSIQLDRLCSKNSPIPQRLWVYGDEGKVYIRITQRMMDHAIAPTIDLATVEIDEEFQNQGVFKELLNVVEQKAVQYNRQVYLENVLNEVLIAPLQKYGYLCMGNDYPPSFFKSFPVPQPQVKTTKTKIS